MTELAMPKLSDSMEEGTILSWLKADGDTIEAGEDLVEIETDKATITHPADASGVLTIVAPEGTSLPVGALIARVTPDKPVPASPSAAMTALVEVADDGTRASNGSGRSSQGAAATTGVDEQRASTVRATPLARRIAAANAVALEEVEGSGPLGRITRADVLRKAGIADVRSPLPGPPAREPYRVADVPPASEPPPASGAKGEVVVIEPTRLQTTVARRMAEAKATIPHFQVQAEVTMEAAIAFRAQLRETGAEPVPSLNDLIVKAAALALRAHPPTNGAYRDGHFERYARVNVGIAVAAEGALVVPTIFDADVKSLGAIAAESHRLAAGVRDGTVTPAELAGATFTVSNLGMYGMTAITPVINSPQAAILGAGAMRQVLARVNGEIVDRQLMTLTLSCDHRILYGAQAAEFLSTVRDLLEQPLRLAL
jgi:pyruvate dehydrogenase E2 component (dihydrolipoamide acetyltransferase)